MRRRACAAFAGRDHASPRVRPPRRRRARRAGGAAPRADGRSRQPRRQGRRAALALVDSERARALLVDVVEVTPPERDQVRTELRAIDAKIATHIPAGADDATYLVAHGQRLALTGGIRPRHPAVGPDRPNDRAASAAGSASAAPARRGDPDAGGSSSRRFASRAQPHGAGVDAGADGCNQRCAGRAHACAVGRGPREAPPRVVPLGLGR